MIRQKRTQPYDSAPTLSTQSASWLHNGELLATSTMTENKHNGDHNQFTKSQILEEIRRQELREENDRFRAKILANTDKIRRLNEELSKAAYSGKVRGRASLIEEMVECFEELRQIDVRRPYIYRYSFRAKWGRANNLPQWIAILRQWAPRWSRLNLRRPVVASVISLSRTCLKLYKKLWDL